jgi:hypothetical protein
MCQFEIREASFFVLTSVADPECFISDPGSEHFSSRIRIRIFFHPGSYMKWGCKLTYFLLLVIQE